MLKWTWIKYLITLGWGDSLGFLGTDDSDAHQHPNQREASATWPGQCTKGVPGWGRQWLWMWLTQLPRLYPVNYKPSTILSVPTLDSYSAHPWTHSPLGHTESRCSEIKCRLKLLNQNSCEILMPLASLRHRIHCESLISNTSRKILLLSYWQREVSWRFW